MLTSDPGRSEQAAMSVSRLIEIQEKTFQKQLDWIRQADKKAQILMGTNLAMVGALLSLTSKPSHFSLAHPLIVIVGAVLPGLSLVSCTSATSPSIGHRQEHDLLVLGRLRVLWHKGKRAHAHENRLSLIFFGHIPRLSLEEYSARVDARTPDEYLADLNSQCYINARIADLKFARLRIAGNQLLLGILPWALAIYILRTF